MAHRRSDLQLPYASAALCGHDGRCEDDPRAGPSTARCLQAPSVRGGRKQGVQYVSLDAAGWRQGWGHSPSRFNDIHHPLRGRRKPGELLEEYRHQVIGGTIRHGSVLPVLAAACMWMPVASHAQNRGVYPLGMTAINSGVMPESTFTHSNQV